MTAYVALLRAVNVGGTGKLPMTELKAMCEHLGFTRVQTYIASGNVVFQSSLLEAEVKNSLEAELAKYAGKPVGVIVRTAQEMAAILAADPFPDAPGNLTVAIFLDQTPPVDTFTCVSNKASEQIQLGTREIYIHYPSGQGQSRLKIPAAANGTARNRNTIAKLAEMVQAL